MHTQNSMQSKSKLIRVTEKNHSDLHLDLCQKLNYYIKKYIMAELTF